MSETAHPSTDSSREVFFFLQVYNRMNDICLCVDLDGFHVEGDFIAREMGWCDKSGLQMGFQHYSHNYEWFTLSEKDKRIVNYVRNRMTGLTFKPAPVEWERGCIGSQESVVKDILSLWERFKTPKQCVVAYKGGTVEKELLVQSQIPYVNLEDFGCPKVEHLPEYYFSFIDCGCHLNNSRNRRFHCSMGECYAFMRWFNENTQ